MEEVLYLKAICGFTVPEKCTHPLPLYSMKTRNTSHPREFLKNYKGICVTDGYRVYHTLEKERKDLIIAGY